jgi:hypothetical protein
MIVIRRRERGKVAAASVAPVLSELLRMDDRVREALSDVKVHQSTYSDS